MPKPIRKAIAATLLDQCGRTYAREAAFTVRNTLASLLRLLVLSILLSARIRADIAEAAAKALAEQGWTTPQRLLASTWKE